MRGRGSRRGGRTATTPTFIARRARRAARRAAPRRRRLGVSHGHAPPPRRTPAGPRGAAEIRARYARRAPSSAPAPSQSAGIAATTASTTAARPRGQPRVGLGDRARDGQQHVLGEHRRERRGGRARRASSAPCWRKNAAPWSMSHGRRAPDEQVGVAGVRSTFVSSASNHTMSAASSGSSGDRAGARTAARQAGSPGRGCRPALAGDQLLDLGVGLGMRRARGRRRRGRSRARAGRAPGRARRPPPRRRARRALARAAELETYSPSSSASTSPGSEPPSRSGVT